MLCALGGDADEVLQTLRKTWTESSCRFRCDHFRRCKRRSARRHHAGGDRAQAHCCWGRDRHGLPRRRHKLRTGRLRRAEGAPHPDNAKLFLDFAVSYDVQQLLQTDFYRRSVRSDVRPASQLPELSAIRQVAYDVKLGKRAPRSNSDELGLLSRDGGGTMKRLHFSSFRQRLNAAFLAVSLVPMLLCSGLLLQIFRLRMTSNAQQTAQQQLAASCEALDTLHSGFFADSRIPAAQSTRCTGAV